MWPEAPALTLSELDQTFILNTAIFTSRVAHC
jgi:hypothetical protein